MKELLWMGLAAALVAGCDEKADIVMSAEGPVRTPAAALAKARELRASGAVKGRPVTVFVKPGRYFVGEPTVFGPEDSGIHFYGRGYGDTVFDGGERLPPFRETAGGLWETDVRDGFDFEQLWVNDRRAQRARTPNRFYLYMKERDFTNGKAAFFARKADIAPLLSLPKDELDRVVVGVWQSWDMGYGRVKSIDAATGHVVMKDAIGHYDLFFWNKTCPRYSLENYRGALDAPGEWFLDVKARKLLYMPRPGERPETAVAIAPVAKGLVVLDGDREKGRIVRDVAFRGIGFEHTAFLMGPGGQKAGQSVANVPDAMIRANGAEKVVFENCRVAHAAMHGIWLRKGCKDSVIRHCLVEDLGAGGVYFGDMGADFKNRGNNAANLEIVDSIVRHGGRLMNGGIGVWIGKAHDCSVVRNDIYDFFYTGVSSGWTWGYAETINRNIRVNHNRIHHIGQGVLSDMGGFYSLGDHTGSEVRNNWVWEVNGYADNGSPAWGLYTDEGSKGIVFSDNLVEKCRDGAVHQHYGTENLHTNSIFLTFNRFGVWRSRNEDHITLRINGNVFWWNDPEAGTYTGGGGYESLKDLPADGNLYWCTAGQPGKTAFKGQDWEAWRKAGKDAHGAIADPLFVDPANGDWRFRPDSPALGMGFRPFDWKDSGVCASDPDWVKKAAEETWDAFEDAPKAPRYLIERAEMDFERFPVGPLRDGMGGMLPLNTMMGKPGGLSFTDKDVAQGRRALVFTDTPENAHSFCPHVSLPCCVTGGTAVIRFAFKPVKGAGMTFEARDYGEGGGFATGLSFGYHGTGLSANGKRIAEVKPGTWADVEVRIGFGGAFAGKWSVAVTPRGGERKSLTFDRFSSAKFRCLTWVGFMTYGSNDSIWQLDDLRLSKED